MQNLILLVELNRHYYCFGDWKVNEKKHRFSKGLTEYIPSVCQLGLISLKSWIREIPEILGVCPGSPGSGYLNLIILISGIFYFSKLFFVNAGDLSWESGRFEISAFFVISGFSYPGLGDFFKPKILISDFRVFWPRDFHSRYSGFIEITGFL